MKRTCKITGCEQIHYGLGYCLRHYKQIKDHGKVHGNPSRPKDGTPSRCFIEGDICKIELCSRDGSAHSYAIVDAEDYDKVSCLRWFVCGTGHVVSSARGGRVYRLHRLVFGAPNGAIVDHADRNPLNNRKENLRLANKSQNAANSKISSNNTSGYTGVCFDKTTKRWIATIKHNNQRIWLGRHSNPVAAAEAYNAAAVKCFGEFAKLNTICTP